MYKDEIVEEVRKEREAYAAKFGFDLHKIYLDIMKRQKARKGVKIISAPTPSSRKRRMQKVSQRNA
ncbi:MAG: hypothetical protein V1913_04335 [Fibrobacterota bacterium]